MAPADKYNKVIAYAAHHARAPMDRLVLQSVCAGLWVGFSGHAATATAASFYSGPEQAAIAKWVHATLFPVAIWGIFFTGAELYTGNTMAMSVNLLHGKSRQAINDLVRVFFVNTVGNCAGCLLTAVLLSWLAGSFHPENAQGNAFVGTICAKKLSYTTFLPPFSLAVAANFFVCTAVFSALIIEETIGKMVALWFFVAVFCFGGLEHIVANFYLTSLCGLIPPHSSTYNFGLIIWRNWVPVWLGNTFAGCFLTGAIWWYALRPLTKSQLPLPSTQTSPMETNYGATEK